MRSLLLPLLALAACGVGSAQQQSMLATPLFAWSSHEGCFKGEPGSAREAASDLPALLSDLVAGLAGAPAAQQLIDHEALAGAAPEVILVLLGSELRTSDLRRKHVAALQALVEAAPSSLAMPYVMHPAEEAPVTLSELREAVEARLPENLELQTAGCGEGRALSDAAALLSAPGAPRVLLGCTAAPPAGAAGSKAGVEAELAQVQAAHDAVRALGKRQATLYAVRPADVVEQRRRLMAAGVRVGPYTVCDSVCRTQVKWLEGMLALLLIIVASLSGMCCLGVLDTPTRFETPKDTARTD